MSYNLQDAFKLCLQTNLHIINIILVIIFYEYDTLKVFLLLRKQPEQR